MRIPQGVILIWPGTNSSIPSGWTREIALDGKFPKAWGIENPNITGGAENHSHVGIAHSHSMNPHSHNISGTSYYNSGSEDTGGANQYEAPDPNHFHNGNTISTTIGGSINDTVNFGATYRNNYPPYYDVIFIKAGSSSILQQNIIALWTGWQGNNNPPNNWQECNGNNGSPDLRNRYLRGADTGQDAGGTGGTLYHTHDLSHTHTHYHTGTTGDCWPRSSIYGQTGAGGPVHGRDHYVTLPEQTLVTDSITLVMTSDTVVEPAYKKVMAIQFKTGATKAKGIIGLWLGNTSDIPKGWVLCDGNNGTIDLRDKFIKIANNSSEIGQTGGSNTHTHTGSYCNHNHIVSAPHNHGGSGIVGNETSNIQSTTTGGPLKAKPHSGGHTFTIYNNNEQVTFTYSTMSCQNTLVDNQPPYRTVAYIQFQKETNTGALLSFFTKILQ